MRNVSNACVHLQSNSNANSIHTGLVRQVDGHACKLEIEVFKNFNLTHTNKIALQDA